MAVTSLAFAVELGGVSRSLELVTSVNDHLWILVVGLALGPVLWPMKFKIVENDFGLVGLERPGSPPSRCNTGPRDQLRVADHAPALVAATQAGPWRS